jgi:hypothetical protein
MMKKEMLARRAMPPAAVAAAETIAATQELLSMRGGLWSGQTAVAATAGRGRR